MDPNPDYDGDGAEMQWVVEDEEAKIKMPAGNSLLIFAFIPANPTRRTQPTTTKH
jgi:hypothetical protein